MRDVAEIIKRRSAPGIFIFNENAELVFSNSEASELVADRPSLDEEVRTLCDRVKVSSGGSPGRKGKGIQLTAFCGGGRRPDCAIRAFMVGEAGKGQRYIIVLLEKVVEKRSVDLEGAKARFNLSKRELEVLVPIHEGLTNKAISERLFISEQTVKDHIRNIMRKVGVNSRGALIAALQ
jgi:DNA-binding CsgD family transcriptional regulator